MAHGARVVQNGLPRASCGRYTESDVDDALREWRHYFVLSFYQSRPVFRVAAPCLEEAPVVFVMSLACTKCFTKLCIEPGVFFREAQPVFYTRDLRRRLYLLDAYNCKPVTSEANAEGRILTTTGTV